jgi:hypothetical protein
VWLLADQPLNRLNPTFCRPYPEGGRPTIPQEQQLLALLLQAISGIRWKRMQEQLGLEQKELQETLRLVHLRGDLLQLQRPSDEGGGYQLPEGLVLHRRQGRKQWRYSQPDVASEFNGRTDPELHLTIRMTDMDVRTRLLP